MIGSSGSSGSSGSAGLPQPDVRGDRTAEIAALIVLLVFVAGRCLVPMDETDLFFNLRLGEIVLARHAEMETAAQKHTKARILGMFDETVWEQILESVTTRR